MGMMPGSGLKSRCLSNVSLDDHVHGWVLLEAVHHYMHALLKALNFISQESGDNEMASRK